MDVAPWILKSPFIGATANDPGTSQQGKLYSPRQRTDRGLSQLKEDEFL
jgi:hypothetical protein